MSELTCLTADLIIQYIILNMWFRLIWLCVHRLKVGMQGRNNVLDPPRTEPCLRINPCLSAVNEANVLSLPLKAGVRLSGRSRFDVGE